MSVPHSVALAGEKGYGIMATSPDRKLVDDFRDQAPGRGPTYAEALLAYAASPEEGLRIAHERFRFGVLGWSVNSELPSVEAFEAATRFIKLEDMKDGLAAGPEVAVHLAAIREYVDAGFDHIVLVAPGPDQAGFIAFFENELRPALAELE